MMDLNAFYLCLLLPFCIETKEQKITWEAKTPITFGGDAELICNIPCCIDDSKSQASWHVKRGNESINVAINEQSRYPTKYQILTGQNSCRLVIKNFEPLDVNIMYTCTHNFESSTKMLTLEENSFESQPTNKTMTVRDASKHNLYMVNATFSDVYPEPKCKATYNGNNLTSDIITRSHRIGIVYWFSIEISVLQVEGKFLMTCKVGETEYRIKEVVFNNIYKDSSFAKPVLITAIITFLITILLAMFLMWDTTKGFGVILSILLSGKNPFPVDILSNAQQRIEERPTTRPVLRYSVRSESTIPLLGSYEE